MQELLIAIVQNGDMDRLSRALVRNRVLATKFNSEGLFLNKKNTTLLICIDKEREEEILKILRDNCTERNEGRQVTEYNGNEMVDVTKSVKIGGATVFIVDVDKMIKF